MHTPTPGTCATILYGPGNRISRTSLDKQGENLSLSISARAIAVVRRLWRKMPMSVRVRIFSVIRIVIVFFAPRFQRISIDLERDYPKWIAQWDQLTDADITAITAHIAGMNAAPKISVVMPVFNPAPDHLRSAIRSVQNQIYPYWELCIADDASTDPAVIAILDQAATADERVRLVRHETNRHVSAASNSALALATGTFVALLDHDDELPRHALYEVAAELQRHPDADVIFSDEDRIDDRGQRSLPNFKPGWNPDLMLGQNLICHLGVYRLALLRLIGGFREGFEGSQDYDLALRAVARSAPARIRHIPAILYHWRQSSRVSFSEALPMRCAANARAAVHDYLEGQGFHAKVVPVPAMERWTRVIWPIPDPAPLVSVIVPTRDHADMLKVCLNGVLNRTGYRNIEVLIADNDSVDAKTFALFAQLQKDKRVRIIPSPGPFNYSAINNRAVKEARGELILLLNNDIDVIGPDWLTEMVSQAVRPGIGAVGAKLLFRNGLIQHGGVLIGMSGVAGHLSLLMRDGNPGYLGQLALARDILAVTGACLLVRKAVFEAAGGLNEDALSVNFNDVDLCLRISEMGYLNLWTPYAKLYHLESASRGLDLAGEKLARRNREVAWMQQRWGPLLKDNPDANPNLILDHPHYRLAFPPRRRKPWRT